MASATFQVSVGGGPELQRVLGKLLELATTTQKQIGQAEQRQMRDSLRLQDSHVKEFQKFQKEQTRIKLRELAEQSKAEEKSARDAQKAQREATRLVAAESRNRTREAKEEAREIEKLAQATLRARKHAEDEATREAQAAGRRRVALARQQAAEEASIAREARGVASGWGSRAAGAVVGGLSSFASTMHGQIQDARERRAVTERVLGQSLYQVGGNRADVVAGMSQITQFAQTNRMDSAELAAGISAAQGQFSVLEGPGSMQSKIQRQLQIGLLARNTGNDPGEMMRLAGMLSQTGVGGDLQRRALLYTAGAAQHGAVETGNLTKEGLAAITRRMSDATASLGPGATREQREAAEMGAFRQSVSELEVAKGFGNNTRQAGNAMAALSRSLTSSATQSKMLTNIRESGDLSREQKAGLERELFDHGRLRSTNALVNAEAFARVAGNNPGLMNNVFAGGGFGNPQSLQKNWRDMMGMMTSVDAGGRSGAQRIRALMDERSTSLSEADVNRGSEIFGSDELSKLTGEREGHDNAVNDNTSALKQLSDLFARFTAMHPIATAAGSAAVGAVGSTITGAAGAALGARLLGPAARASVAAARMGAPGIGATALSALAPVLGVAGAGIAGLVGADQVVRRTIGKEGLAPGRTDSVFESSTWRVLFNGIKDAIQDGMRHATVSVSPHDAQHAATVASTRPTGR